MCSLGDLCFLFMALSEEGEFHDPLAHETYSKHMLKYKNNAWF